MSMPELTVVNQVDKEVDYNVGQEAGLGEVIFTQAWWLDPFTKLGEHLHEGMAEVIGLVGEPRGSVRMLVWLEQDLEPYEYLLDERGKVVFIPTGCKHAIINATEDRICFSATGIKTRENGQTIRFE